MGMLSNLWRRVKPLHPTARMYPESLAHAVKKLLRRGYVVLDVRKVRLGKWEWSRIYLTKGRGTVVVITEPKVFGTKRHIF